jgi:hypothetical protein
MSRTTPIPFFPSPPRDYDQAYFSQLIRNFSVFAQQTQVPGPQRATTLKLTALPVFADDTGAIAGGLTVGDIYRTGAGALRAVV